MRRTKPKSTEEKRRVIWSTLFSTLLRAGVVVVLLCFCRRRPPGLVRNVFLILAAANLITILFTFVVLRQRLREIEEGELDEARKY